MLQDRVSAFLVSINLYELLFDRQGLNSLFLFGRHFLFGGNFCQCETRPALFGIGVVGQIPDAAPAVAATLWQVRVLGREEPFIDAGVEAEDGGLVVAEPVEAGGGLLALADGLLAVG